MDVLLSNGPGILLALGAVLSAFVAGLYIGVKAERSRCLRWRRECEEENKRLVQEAMG